MTTTLPAQSPVAAGQRATSDTWRLGDAVLLRVAGQPVDRVERVSFTATADWARDLLDRRGQRDAAAEAVQEALTAAVARCPGEHPERIALINLRRDAFNGRRPRPATLTKAEPLLSADDKDAIERWTTLLAECAALAAEGAAILDEEVRTVRHTAREVLADDRLRAAVLLQSAVLERTMDRYLDPRRKLDKGSRQVERTLLELLYRAAMKTSPFSTLTSVGLATFASGSGSDYPRPTSLAQTARASMNVAVAARLAQHIAQRSDLRSGLAVTLTPGVRTEEDLVRYVRRRTTASPDPDAVVTVDSVHESLFYLPSGAVLSELTDYLQDHPAATVADLAAHLHDSAPNESRPMEQVDRLIGHLLRLGFLLLPELQVDLHAPHPCRVFAETLQGQDHPTLREIGADLHSAMGLVERYTATPARERAAALGAVRELVDSALARAGATPEATPRTLVYEDAFTTDPALHVDRDSWERTHLPKLSALADILPAFDLNLPRRLTTTGFFTARYGVGGVCQDLERFCHEYQQDFFDPYVQRAMRRTAFDDDNVYQPQENWFQVDRIRRIDNARERAATHLDRTYRTGPDCEEIALGDDFVSEVRQALGSTSGMRTPWSFFVQVAGGPDRAEPALVLNQAYAGMTTMFSRFVHGLEETNPGSADVLRQVLLDSVPEDTVLAELGGGYETSNLNVHPPLTSHELVCPGDVSGRPPQEQIRLSELAIVHDPDSETLHLWCERLGRRVLPVYLGFLMPMALPELQQVLLCFSPAAMAPIDLWAGTGTPVASDRVNAYPRVTLHGLVLQRRMWKLDRDLFPTRDPGGHAADYFLDVQLWRVEHQLPRRVFAHIDFDAGPVRAADDGGDGGSDGGTRGADGGTGRKSTRKPLAVDFDNWTSVQLLEQLVLAAKSRVTFKEALPDIDEVTLSDEHGAAHVSELVVEIYPEEHQ